MKTLASLIVLAMALTACSSKDKKAEASASPEKSPAVTAPAPTAQPSPTPAPAAKAEKKAKKQKKVKAEAAATEAAPAAAATAGMMTCKHGGDTRTVEVKDADKGCEVFYNKGGEAKSVASAKSDKSFCEGVKAKIEKNLTGAGFTCQ